MLSIHKSFNVVLIGLFVFAVHFSMPTPGGSGLYLPFNAMTWVFVATIIGLGLWQVAKQQRLLFHPIYYFLLIGFLLFLVPFLFQAPFSDNAIPRVLGLLMGLFFLVAMNQFQLSGQKLDKLLFLIVIGCVITTVVCLVQYYFITDKPFFGYIPKTTRPHGLFLQPNVTASFIATGLMTACFLITKPKVHNLSTTRLTFLYTAIVAFTLVICLLQSRTAFIACIIAPFLIAPYAIKHNKKATLYILFSVLAGIAISFYTPEQVTKVERGEQTYQSVGVRDEIYRVSTKMILDKPLTGFGYGYFEKSYREFHLRLMPDNPELGLPLKNLTHPHNEWLLWGVEGGIVAILGLVFFLLGYLYLFGHTDTRLSMALVALILPIALHSQTEYPFYHSTPHFALFLIIIHISQTLTGGFKSINLNHTLLLKTSAILIPVFCIPFMLSSLQSGYMLNKYIQSNAEKPEYLTKIINPIIWQSLLEKIAYNRKLLVGIANKDPQALKDYINWGKTFVRDNPEKSVYQNMITAIRILEKTGNSLDDKETLPIVIEASNLYPDEVHWNND